MRIIVTLLLLCVCVVQTYAMVSTDESAFKSISPGTYLIVQMVNNGQKKPLGHMCIKTETNNAETPYTMFWTRDSAFFRNSTACCSWGRRAVTVSFVNTLFNYLTQDDSNVLVLTGRPDTFFALVKRKTKKRGSSKKNRNNCSTSSRPSHQAFVLLNSSDVSNESINKPNDATKEIPLVSQKNELLKKNESLNRYLWPYPFGGCPLIPLFLMDAYFRPFTLSKSLPCNEDDVKLD